MAKRVKDGRRSIRTILRRNLFATMASKTQVVEEGVHVILTDADTGVCVALLRGNEMFDRNGRMFREYA